MSKIFRLHTGATENIEHWQSINEFIRDSTIDNIPDPAGANIGTQITSIPSPFARMDLVKTSFKFVNNRRDLRGNTIYHRMVSECLDVAEIFFNIQAFQDKIEILEWNSGIINNNGRPDIDNNSDLGKLLNSNNPKHKLLGETLKMFLIQDANEFNFSKLKHIYLLNYINGPELLNIIGGTSPSTMFFSSANDLSFVDITFGNDRMFDLKLCPLIDRGTEFIMYMYAFRKSYNGFEDDFSELNSYLDLTFEQLDDLKKENIRKIDENTYNSTYIKLSVNSEGNNAEILGNKLLIKNYGNIHEVTENDFKISNTKPYLGRIPCVLPIDSFNEELNYVGGTWKINYHEKVPKFDDRPLDQRTLPNQTQIVYPYLTISDLLEPYIIKLPYPIDSEKFFNGNYEIKKGVSDHSFILPIKKQLFDFFTIEDILGVVGDGKNMIDILQLPDGVKVILRIPIQKNQYIQYSRIYNNNQFQDKIQQPDEKNNIGVVIENQMTIALYPFIKTTNNINPHYRVLCVDRDVAISTKNINYNLNFYCDNNPSSFISGIPKKNRSNKNQSHGVTTNYYIVEQNFDFIEVSHNNATGIVIPKFIKIPTPAHTFKFAIDFGTTNTHIEYKSTITDSKPFEITEKDIQFATLHEPGVNSR